MYFRERKISVHADGGSHYRVRHTRPSKTLERIDKVCAHPEELKHALRSINHTLRSLDQDLIRFVQKKQF